MQNIIRFSKVNKNLLIKILIVLSIPIITSFVNMLVLTVFNLGSYCGTFIRYLFSRVVC